MNISQGKNDSSLTPLSNSGDFKFISDNAAVIGVLLGSVGVGGFEFCTESKASEKTTESMKGCDLLTDSSPSFGSLMESKSMERKPGIRRLKKELEDFPPLLSTLDKSGRPRFTLIKLRSGGRLMIALVRSDRPRIIRSYGKDGGLILQMVKWNGDGEDSEKVGEERPEDRS